ncbi:MAG: glycosyltransferase family 2 protein [Prevotella sp.]|nr:glycosyltransferase family 2 protein [Prevotella sp.]
MQPDTTAHFVSVIIPVLNEALHVENCLNSISAQDYPASQMEILVVDGMSDDGTRDIIERMCHKDSRIKLLENKKRIVPCAMNIGIRAAKGDIIMRMDCHCIYPVNYMSTLVRKLIELKAANVGGVCITIPADDSTLCQAIAFCMSHPFGTGPSLFRIGCPTVTETDTVPFGCFRKEFFDKVGLFDEDMLRNEDEELNGRIKRQGGKIYLIPEVEIRYMARNNLSKMTRMFYHYGLWKPLVNKKVGNAVSYRQFAPPLFVIAVVLGLILGIFSSTILTLVLIILALYYAIVLIIAAIEAFKSKKPLLLLQIPITFTCMHFAYGIGYLKGFISMFGRKSLHYTIDR